MTTTTGNTEVEPIDLSLVDKVLKKYERLFNDPAEQKAWVDWHEIEGVSRSNYSHLIDHEYLRGIRARVIYIGLHPFEDSTNILVGNILERKLFLSQDFVHIFRRMSETLQRFTFELAVAEDTTLRCLSEEQRTVILQGFSGISYLDVYLSVLQVEYLVDMHYDAFSAIEQIGIYALSRLCYEYYIPFSYKKRCIQQMFAELEETTGEEKDKVYCAISNSMHGICDQQWYNKYRRSGSMYEYFLSSLEQFLAAEPSDICKNEFWNNGFVPLLSYLDDGDLRKKFGMWLFGGDWPGGPQCSNADYKAEFAPYGEEISLNFDKWAKAARESLEFYRKQREEHEAKIALRKEIENAIKRPEFRKST